jgi:hypothetical protein
MIAKNRIALVERPVACSGKGEYIALVHYGSPGGLMHHKTFEYSRKDPRQLGEAHSLRGIAQMIPSHHRPFIVAISVIKRCLHPQSPDVAKVDRSVHIERVFSWVVEHGNSTKHSPERAKQQYVREIVQGNDVQRLVLPYTPYELHELPIKQVVTTNYWEGVFASIGMRGVERRVKLDEIVV